MPFPKTCPSERLNFQNPKNKDWIKNGRLVPHLQFFHDDRVTARPDTSNPISEPVNLAFYVPSWGAKCRGNVCPGNQYNIQRPGDNAARHIVLFISFDRGHFLCFLAKRHRLSVY